MMIMSLVALLGTTPLPPARPAAAQVTDPPIHVWLNSDNVFERGDRARVKFKLADDGYVVVLRADAYGRVRVLFPLDPGTDNFARGGKTFEVRGRGDRDAFEVDDDSGQGTVFAAVSPQPFTFTQYVRGDHWDYRVLGQQPVGNDPESDLTDLVRTMAGENHFDYDLVTYSVGPQDSRSTAYSGYYGDPFAYAPIYPYYNPCWACGPWYPGSGLFIGLRFGGYGYPFGCWDYPFCGFGYGNRYGFGGGYGRPWYGGYGVRYAGGFSGRPPVFQRPPFILPNRSNGVGVGVRPRVAPSPVPVGRRGIAPVARANPRPEVGQRGRAHFDPPPFAGRRSAEPRRYIDARPGPRAAPAPRAPAPRSAPRASFGAGAPVGWWRRWESWRWWESWRRWGSWRRRWRR